MTESTYFRKLKITNPAAALRYQNKIAIIGNLDPFALDASTFSIRPQSFPSICNVDIVNYLVLTTSYYTLQQMKAFKSLNAFKYFEAGFVTACGSLKVSDDNYVIQGKIKHSQRQNLPPLQAWAICQVDGSVKFAHCTCMAGLGEVCSHVEALLFATEFIVSSYKNTSCTDIAAAWAVPSTSKVDPVPIEKMQFKSVFSYPVNDNVPPLSPMEIVSMLKDIEAVNSSSVIMRVTEPFATAIAESVKSNLDILNPFKNLYSEELESLSLEELVQLGSTVYKSISEDDCKKICEATIKQAKCPLWVEQRIGRITASIFKRVVRTSLEKPSLSLLKCICYPLSVSFITKATQWGKMHEKDALKAYQQESSMCHENLEITAAGLCISFEKPQIAASPDGFVSCSCCGLGCIEVKCPITLKDTTIEAYANERSTSLKFLNGEIYLDNTHPFYFQIQFKRTVG